MNKEAIAERFRELQDFICAELERVDGVSSFREDLWNRPEGGGGRTRTISGSGVIAKGGVAFSEVFGSVSDVMKRQMGIQGDAFFATGVSIVLHPHHPLAPIIHMNVRYFELDSGEHWFGGGIDLTPHYVDVNMARRFHERLKAICDSYSENFYPTFKHEADEYFYNVHRGETRGIGGIFYDHQMANDEIRKEDWLDFAIDLGEAFPFIYEEQILAKIGLPFSGEELKWRDIRRGRYVEFNLVHDRGTKFGLVSGGRTESILMSLPPEAQWEYMHEPVIGSQEQQTLDWLKKGVDWLNA